MTALGLRRELVGKKTIAVADVLTDLADTNYFIQYNSTKNYEEATHQAEKILVF